MSDEPDDDETVPGTLYLRWADGRIGRINVVVTEAESLTDDEMVWRLSAITTSRPKCVRRPGPTG
jgi:hypothetical protein